MLALKTLPRFSTISDLKAAPIAVLIKPRCYIETAVIVRPISLNVSNRRF